MSSEDKILKKAKTHKGRKYLDSLKPKIFEKEKKTIFVKGTKTSDLITKAMQNMYLVKKDYSLFLSDRWDIHPFDSQEKLEHLCTKHDAAFFAFGSSSKKRPNNIVIGRIYDNQILDMAEFGVSSFKAMENAHLLLHHRPVIIFQGDLFEYEPTFMRLKNLLLDFFVENVKIPSLNIQEGLSRVTAITAIDDKTIFIRNYEIKGKSQDIINKDEKDLAGVLPDIGASYDLTIRRTKLADADQYKKACKHFKPTKLKNEKNIKTNALGEARGRVFLDRQNLDSLGLFKRKKLKTESKSNRKDSNAKKANANKVENLTKEVDV